MSRVEAEAARMGLLVDDLLTLARIDQQRPLAKAPVDLLTLAADAVQDARIVAQGRPVDLVVAPGTAFIVDGDEPRLRQVIGNLVNNALTHTPAGTPVRLKIGRGTLEDDAAGLAGRAELGRARRLGQRGRGQAAGRRRATGAVPAVVLDVEDDGPGMSADQAQRVFERFYRADAARNRASGGTGLGLAIVAGLVAAHGGTVSVRTAPGQGADFQVKLPLSPDALPADEPEDDLPALHDGSEPGGETGHAGFQQGEDVGEVGVGAVVRVGDVLAVQAADLAEEPDPALVLRSGHGAQVTQVGGVHGEDQVAFRQPGRVELAGAVRLAVVAVAGELPSRGGVHARADVPVAGACAVHEHRAGQAGLGQLVAQHDLGHRGAADVAEADAADAVGAVRVTWRRQRGG